jgi:hypothetical protein
MPARRRRRSGLLGRARSLLGGQPRDADRPQRTTGSAGAESVRADVRADWTPPPTGAAKPDWAPADGERAPAQSDWTPAESDWVPRSAEHAETKDEQPPSATHDQRHEEWLPRDAPHDESGSEPGSDAATPDRSEWLPPADGEAATDETASESGTG